MTFQAKFNAEPSKFDVGFGTSLNISGGYDDGYNDGYTTGKAEGLTEGEEIGYGKGEAAGYENGYTEGDAKGYERGLTDGNANAMQEFVDNRKSLAFLYREIFTSVSPPPNTLAWLEKVDLSKVASFKDMFSYCYKLTDADIPVFDIGTADCSSMFYYCNELTRIPKLDYSKSSRTTGLFYHCIGIETVESLDVSNSKDIQTMFYECSGLVSVGEIKISKTQSVSGGNMFYRCSKLKSVGTIDARKINSLYWFASCPALENVEIKNISVNFQIASGTSWGHKLTVDCLVGLCYELRDMGSSRTFTIGSANLEKLANVYVREIPITDAMREADDLIDEKLPFEVCDSTADGATLITDYLLLKNWKLA